MIRSFSSTLAAASIGIFSTFGAAQAELTFFDLTQPIPTFEPSVEDPTKPDLSKPIGKSAPISAHVLTH